MDAYASENTPDGFGLNNTGVICYFNSFLQALVGCPAFTRAVLQHKGYVMATRTGSAMVEFISAFASLRDEFAISAPRPDIMMLSEMVLRALVADLAVRRPRVRFGCGQESASEALMQLLDMMEPAIPHERKDAPPAPLASNSPITKLFIHRFRCDMHCRGCNKIVSKNSDHAVNFNLFHIDEMAVPPTSVESFSAAMRRQVSIVTEYRCPLCPCSKCGGPQGDLTGKCADRNCDAAIAQTTAIRVYHLTMVPEIIFCMFNMYEGFGGHRIARYFPERLEFPATETGNINYRMVAQVEQSGSLAGGHYWARGLRRGERVILFNDAGMAPSTFTPTANTYFVVYHYADADADADVSV